MTRILLVGLGVVGRAIALAHLRLGIPVDVLDVDAAAIDRFAAPVDGLPETSPWKIENVESPLPGLFAARISPAVASSPKTFSDEDPPVLLIESIAERVDLKKQFFASAQRSLPSTSLFCSNTSTLPIATLARELPHPGRVAGMHFFMPVDHRDAVEVIATSATEPAAVRQAVRHARRLRKQPILVGDAVGFVVNRLLAPYLNEAITLLCRHARAEQIRDAAVAFGMPLSPLELVDLIGIRTAFDGGRSYWQAFPRRMTTAPLLPALIKRGRLGRHAGGGFFDYPNDGGGEPIDRVAPADETIELVRRYTRNGRSWTIDQIHHRLATTMWTEAACILHDGIVNDLERIDAAMSGGLGYRREPGQSAVPFLSHMDRLGIEIIRGQLGGDDPIHAPEWLRERLDRIGDVRPGSPGPTEVLRSIQRP